MRRIEEDPRLLRLAVWSGPFLFIPFFLALFGGHILPPKPPASSATSIAAFYRTHATAIRIATTVLLSSCAFWVTWCVGITVFIRAMERGRILSYAMIALTGGTYLLFLAGPAFWAVAAYQPFHVAPDVTLTLHNAGWFWFLWDAEPFSAVCFVIAIAVLRDRNLPGLLPRWTGYASIWAGFMVTPACLMAFFKHGPFGYNGLLALYVPVGAFGLWMLAMASAMEGAIRRERLPASSSEHICPRAQATTTCRDGRAEISFPLGPAA